MKSNHNNYTLSIFLLILCIAGSFVHADDLPIESPRKSLELKWDDQDEKKPQTYISLYDEAFQLTSKTVVFIIDTSGSMASGYMNFVDENGKVKYGNRLARAKVECIKAISELPQDIRFNVVSYHCGISTAFTGPSPAGPILLKADDKNKTQAISFVRRLYPSGGTATGPATAKVLLNKEVLDILLLSDGAPYCGVYPPNVIQKHLKMIQAANTQKATINTIGIGCYGDAEWFMRTIALTTNGIFVKNN